MAKRKPTSSKPQNESVVARVDIDEFLASKAHPLQADIQSIRKLILGADASLREEIKWNSVSFRNDHDFFATLNLRSIDALQLVFHTGVKKKSTAETGVRVDDPFGLIERWPAKDRCIVTLRKGLALKAHQAALVRLVQDWLKFVR